nr:stage II sporulation protein M [uncultured Blautia sp.]
MKKIWEREMWMVLGFLAGCFALGLLGGILFANLAYPWRNGQNQMLELYALTQIKNKKGKSAEYFWYLLENRMFAVAFFLLTGLTGAARFIVVVAAAWMGFLAGAAGSLLILEQGIRGFWTFAGSLFPQMIVYFPAVALLMTKIYKERGNIWKKPVKVIKIYLLTGTAVIFLCLAGVVLEAYVHPVWMRWLLEHV